MKYLTIPQASKIVGITRQGLARLVLAGVIRAERVGPLWLISEKKVEQCRAHYALHGRFKSWPRLTKKYLLKHGRKVL